MTSSYQTVSFRPIADQDRAFLFALYCDIRAQELSQTLMDKDSKDRFLRQQFDAQTKAYAQDYIGAVHRIICLGDEDIGRLIVNRTDQKLHIIDLSLCSSFQGRGIGSQIISALTREAHGAKVPIEFSCEKANPALHLYFRLGFEIIEDKVTHFGLRNAPPQFREI